VIACVMEAAFAASSIVTHTYYPKLRSMAWVGALAAFLVCTLLAVIEWDSRWYALAVLLFVWAVLGAWGLSRTRIEAAFVSDRAGMPGNHTRRGRFIWLGGLVALALASLGAVIQWRTDWHWIAVLLLVWVALGAWVLSRGRVHQEHYSARHTVVSAFSMLLLLVIAVSPALIFPQHAPIPMTGPYPIGTATYTYTDASRIETFAATGEHREVNVECWYPEQATGKYPLVVFSPGSFGTRTSNTSTYRDLASNGYVVCATDHPYHSFFTVDANGRLTLMDWTFMNEAIGVNNDKYNDTAKFALTKEWMRIRTGDIGFVLDTILQRASDPSSGRVYQLIDIHEIGLMGHSLGGAAVVQVARDRADVEAVINMDADLIGEYRQTAAGEHVVNRDIYPVPILSIYSDDLVNLLVSVTDPNNVIAGKYIAATAPHAYEVHIPDTTHLSLTDLPLTSPFLMYVLNRSVNVGGGDHADKYAIIGRMNGLTLEFFNEYLKGVGTFATAASP
jgi:dienelactone hydrolase